MSTKKTSDGLIAYAKAQLGRPYWMGTFGQIGSAQLYKSNKSRLPAYYTARDFAQQYGERVHDCVGLIKGYLWSDGPNSAPKYCSGNCKIDHSADSMYRACNPRGIIGTMPDKPGILIYMVDHRGVMVHVGIYIGNGQAIEARGHAYGVVQTAIKGRSWTHWGLCPYIDYSDSKESEDTEMLSYDQFKKYMDQYLKELAEAGTYPEAEAAMNKGRAAGIIDGKRPCSYVTRGEMMIIHDREGRLG